MAAPNKKIIPSLSLALSFKDWGGVKVLMLGEHVVNMEFIRDIGRANFEKTLSLLTEEEQVFLLTYLNDPFNWGIQARLKQLGPLEYNIWLILAGRGFGKTRTGAEKVKAWALSGNEKYVNLIGPTNSDVRKVMIEGESGILACCRPDEMPEYNKSTGELLWPNGCKTLSFSSESYERLRGPQSGKIWMDELCAWKYPQETWDMALFGLRLKSDPNPQVVITTTPKPIPLLKKILSDSKTIVTTGSTIENSDNLASNFVEQITEKFEGTRLGRQELYAEVLDDNPGALWNRSVLDSTRVKLKDLPDLNRIVVAVDPPATATGDECGIVVAGRGTNGRLYVLDDVSLQGSPQEWAQEAVKAYKKWDADRVVAEVNQGGDMVETIIRSFDKNISYKAVRASKGKFARAEPVAALYEQGKVSHVGFFSKLEDQMCEYDPNTAKKSPDRMDALVWALTEMGLGSKNTGVLDYLKEQVGQKEGENVNLSEQNPLLASQLSMLDKIFGNKNK